MRLSNSTATIPNQANAVLLLQRRRSYHAHRPATSENIFLVYNLLSSCKQFKPFLQIHAHLIVSGHNQHPHIATHLVNAYSFFRKCDVSRRIFNSTPNPSAILWNSMIRAYVRSNRFRDALRMYRFYMLEEAVEPDRYTFNFVVKACTGALDLREGVLVHGEIVQRGLVSDVFIGTSLVDMYCKMGELRLARQVFDGIPHKDLVACNAMIAGLSQSKDPCKALEFFRSMQYLWGLEPNSVSLLNLVRAISVLADINSCRSIHGYAVMRGFGTAVSNGLIDMYSKCGDVTIARRVFDTMKGRDDISWGTMMSGYLYNDHFLEVLEFFDYVKSENLKMNTVSVISALVAATELRDLEKGKGIHDCALEEGVYLDVLVATSIMTMYAKCGEIEKAKELFDELHEKDVIAHSALISAFVDSGCFEEALSMFRDCQNEYLNPDAVILASILSACSELSSVKLGRSIHCYAIKADIDWNISIGTALVSMYAKCGFSIPALLVFSRMPSKDLVAWNCLINVCTQIGEPYHAIEMFHKLQLSGIKPDTITIVGLIQSYTLLNGLVQGSCIHGQIIKYGFESDSHIKNSLIGMYAKCGSLSSANFLFNRTDLVKNELAWNVLISGFSQSKHAKEAISAFHQMRLENFRPNSVTFVSILPVMAYLSDFRQGMAFHAFIIKMGFLSNTLVGNSLIGMYAKCGQLDFAEKCFNDMKYKNTVSWNTMLSGYSVNGQGDCAVSLFSLMQESNVKVDNLSFISALSACRHAGLVEEGRKIFQSMHEKHHLEPNLEHYACMVDLLGRAGLFDEAQTLISTMPMEPDAGVWGALLGACEMHSDVEFGEIALDHLVKLEPGNPTNYVVLSNIYAQLGRLHDADKTRSKIKDLGLKKTPGCSWV